MAANKSVEDILSQLERVFAGEVEYDEALMELGLHTAQVRKAYPSLYAVLHGGASKHPMPNSETTDFAGMIQAVLEKINNNSDRQRQTVLSGPSAPVEEVEDVHLYSSWARSDAHNSRVGDEWSVDWDVPQVPVPSLGQSITLRGPSHKTRYTVKDLLSETTMRLETVAILPIS